MQRSVSPLPNGRHPKPYPYRQPYASGQKLLRQGVEAAEVPGRLGVRAERWREICGACNVRVVALGVEELA